MGKGFAWKDELLIGLIALPFAFGSVYVYKHYVDPPLEVRHEHALPWKALEESYQALNGREFLYDETLKQLREMEGNRVAVYGFMYPIKMAEKHDHFLLSKQPHICQFHLPAHSGNMVEILMKDSGIAYRRNPVLLTGRFSIPNDKELGITFRLEEAEYVEE